jgi:hypothetical protein
MFYDEGGAHLPMRVHRRVWHACVGRAHTRSRIINVTIFALLLCTGWVATASATTTSLVATRTARQDTMIVRRGTTIVLLGTTTARLGLMIDT